MVRTSFTSRDLEVMPFEDGKRYEIIGGELYVSRAPHGYHQITCGLTFAALHQWNQQSGLGIVVFNPGIIFGEEDDVIPDLVWASKERFSAAFEADGKVHAALELIVEVLSPGRANTQRDREVKLNLYSRRGVREYWIMDWERKQVEVYRRVEAALHLAATLQEWDSLTSLLLPGFECSVASLFPSAAAP